MQKTEIEWHKYPEDKPKHVDEYLVTVNCGYFNITSSAIWIDEKFTDYENELGRINSIVAWSEMPAPYKEEEMIEEKIKEIAYHYGIEKQLMKLSERCSDLANEAKLCSLNKETSSRLAEMMAEVILLFSQISYLTLSIDRSILFGWLERKVDEQLERIKYGEDE